MKAKLKGAEQGHSLLKRKSEALTKCVDNHSSAYWNLMLTLYFADVSEVNLRSILPVDFPETHDRLTLNRNHEANR